MRETASLAYYDHPKIDTLASEKKTNIKSGPLAGGGNPSQDGPRNLP